MSPPAVQATEGFIRRDAFRDAVVVVTGAASGLGQATALAFAEHGARVIVADIAKAPAEAVAATARKAGGWAQAFAVDVSRRCEVAGLFEHISTEHGNLDVLVSNAGVLGKQVPPEDIEEDEWDRVRGINLKGTFLCCQAAARMMKAQGHGRIVVVGSSAGKQGGPTSPLHYCVTKAGVMCLAKSLARHVAAFGVTVNAVAPGLIDTPLAQAFTPAQRTAVAGQTPLGRSCRPEEVAAAILFLASQGASYITGEIMDVNGGLLMD